MRNFKKLAMVLCFLLVSSSAFALSLGGYAQFEGGSGTVEPDEGDSIDFTSSAWGVGFTLDTDPMTKDLWCYRLNVGYQGLTFDMDEPIDDTLDMTGWFLDNTFAFTIANDGMMRYWAGPVIRLSSMEDDEEGGDVTLGGFGIGVAAGLNYKVADKFVVSPSLNLIYSGLSGEIEGPGYKEDLTGSIFTYGLKVDFLYDL